MKKLFPVMVLILASVPGFAQQGIVKSIVGTVELKPAGESAFAPAKPGDAVAQNTIVSTGFRSTAVITVGSATLTIRPTTRLSLAEISQGQGTEQLSVNLQTGRVRAELKPPEGGRADLSIKAPSATASVRGTIFEIDTHSITVIEGTVAYVGNDGRIMLVSAGGSSQVDPVTGRAADPIETSAAGLLPSSPPGSDESDGAGNSAGKGEVDFTLTLVF
jgi:hypothetical protein